MCVCVRVRRKKRRYQRNHTRCLSAPTHPLQSAIYRTNTTKNRNYVYVAPWLEKKKNTVVSTRPPKQQKPHFAAVHTTATTSTTKGAVLQ